MHSPESDEPYFYNQVRQEWTNLVLPCVSSRQACASFQLPLCFISAHKDGHAIGFAVRR